MPSVPRSVALGASLLWLGVSLGCAPASDPNDAASTSREAENLPPIEMEGVIFEGYHGDLQDLNILASGATVNMATHLANLRDVTIHFTAEDDTGGKKTTSKVQIAAPKGQFHLDGDDFTLTDGVTGTTEEGQRFVTDAVHYVGKTRLLVSDSPVEMHRATLVVTASGMQLEVPTHKIHLTGNVRAQAMPK
ncbi:MAG TPA: LPS export ABC transporter periplasmic protein LptC [Myxococcota bacterium]|nr:LPS export ABC transporter periplasmic protein LptC [Myxococcota bacterium]